VPAGDGVVVERVPADGELAARRAELAARPDDLPAALELAREYLDQGRRLSDPRYLGYAQAALARWWDSAGAPPEVLVLRATIRQSNHDFTGALADLDLVVRARPEDGQAWLTRAIVLQVRGQYAEARRSCEHLAGLTAPLVVATCLAGIDGMTGRADVAAVALERALVRSPSVSAGVRVWAMTLLGELYGRTGGPAERWFREALRVDPTDAYLLAVYADLLLDEGRPAGVIPLLADRTEADNLLLRLVLAERATHAPAAAQHAALLRDRYAASRARGDRVHLREEARFALHVDGDVTAALSLAVDNWRVQHELQDARILLEAAAAAGDPAAAGPVIEWMDANGVADPALDWLRGGR